MPEAAYLAILPKAPSNYDPVRATQKALDRRNYVLREMYKNGYITEDQWHAAAASPLGTIRYGSNEKFAPAGRLFHGGGPPRAHQAVRRRRQGRPQQPLRGGLWVRTSMDPKMQDAGGAGASRRARASSAAGRLERPRDQRSTCRRTGRASSTARRSVPAIRDWLQGRRAVKDRRRGHDRLHQRIERDASRIRARRCRCAASAGPRSSAATGHGHHRQADGRPAVTS